MSNYHPTPQSAEIQRYTMLPIQLSPHVMAVPVGSPCPEGTWVQHSDHSAAIAKLSEERDEALAQVKLWRDAYGYYNSWEEDRAKLTVQISAALAEVERVRAALDEIGTGHLGGNEQTALARDALRGAVDEGVTDPEVLAMLKQSLQEAKHGKLVSLGSFAQYAISDSDVDRALAAIWKGIDWTAYHMNFPQEYEMFAGMARAGLESFVRGNSSRPPRRRRGVANEIIHPSTGGEDRQGAVRKRRRSAGNKAQAD